MWSKLLKAHISGVECAHPKTSEDAGSKTLRALFDQNVALLKQIYGSSQYSVQIFRLPSVNVQ